MSDDFSLLDKYFHSQISAPDEAFDLIFMLDADDWAALDQVWSRRPLHWRQECAYVLHYGPPEKCIPLLRRAIFDDEADVALEAAASLAAHKLETSGIVLTDREREKLAELARHPGAKDFDELHQLLATISDV